MNQLYMVMVMVVMVIQSHIRKVTCIINTSGKIVETLGTFSLCTESGLFFAHTPLDSQV